MTPEDAAIIYRATRDGVFWGSFYATLVFHLFLFGGFIVLYVYFSKKYGNNIKNYSEMITKLMGIHK